MVFLSYTWHKKTFLEFDELQCDTDYGKGYMIYSGTVQYIFYISLLRKSWEDVYCISLDFNFYIPW
jgi:hypothetical protein